MQPLKYALRPALPVRKRKLLLLHRGRLSKVWIPTPQKSHALRIDELIAG